MQPAEKTRIWVGFALTLISAVLWGSTYPVIGIALRYYTPYEIAFFRAGFAAITLSLYYALMKNKAQREIRAVPRGAKTWLLLLGAALFGAAGFWNLLNVSVLFLQPDTATFLTALYPIITVALSVIILKNRMTLGQGVGIVLGIVGSYVIVFFGKNASISGAEPLLGIGVGVATAFSFAGYIIITRILIGRKYGGQSSSTISPEYVTFMIFSVSVVPTFLMVPLTGPLSGILQSSLAGLITVLYLGIIASGVAFLVFNMGLSIIGPSRAAINQLLFPAVSVIISYFVLQETINLSEGIGIALILAGIVVVQVFGAGKERAITNQNVKTSVESRL